MTDILNAMRTGLMFWCQCGGLATQQSVDHYVELCGACRRKARYTYMRDDPGDKLPHANDLDLVKRRNPGQKATFQEGT